MSMDVVDWHNMRTEFDELKNEIKELKELLKLILEELRKS